MSGRGWFCVVLLLLLAVFRPEAADARAIELRAAFCPASAPPGAVAPDAAIVALPYSCAKAPAPDYHDRWLWLRLETPAALGALPAGWQLLVDQTRFDAMAVVVLAKDGKNQRLVIGSSGLGKNWQAGGLNRFTIERPGREIAGVYIGYSRLDDLHLMRKVTAATPQQAVRMNDGWLILMGVFGGALLSAFSYNLLIYTGQRYAFQRWYLIWAATALVYGLIWTNIAAYIVPDIVGPTAVRLEFILVGIMLGAGNMFFLTVLEEGMLPRWLRRAGTALAVAAAVFGALASADWLLPAALTDRLLNVVIALSALSVLAGVCIAIGRGSRIVWFYLVGWTPVLLVFTLRLLRNLGVLPQDDTVDMATFASVAVESVVLALAIADRFRLLRRELDLAEQSRKTVEVESDTLRRAAHTDFLTGLGNRAAFQDALRTMAGQPAFTLYLADVDHLKDSNDRLGHDGGDALLAHIGARLAEAAGPSAHVARIGGDEFAVLVPGPSVDGGLEVAAKLDALQSEKWAYGGRSWSISLSVGSARFPEDGAATDTLYKNADLALYRAKQLGRRRLHRYDPSLRAMVDRKSAFVRDAYAGLQSGAFVLDYQPIVDLSSGRCMGNEALLRWHHPRHGLLTPAIFGDILVETEIGTQIQSLVLALALDQLRGLGADAPFISVNFTAAQLRGPDAARALLDQFKAAEVHPHTLCVELTEGIVLERTANETAAALNVLHDAGVRIALDDFGTGYASLIHLKQLPIDTLKIDRSFVIGLLEDGGQSEEIVRAIIGLGHGLGMAVIAEGIEDDTQRRRLQELGCRLGQGYLFGQPAALLSTQGSAPLMATRLGTV